MTAQQVEDGVGPSFGAWMRRQRDRRLVTQQELAVAAGISVRTVQLLESGAGTVPRVSTRRRIMDALAATPERVPATTAPNRLPPDIATFTGRTVELAELDRAMAGTASGAAPLVLLTGTAGAGKTATAVHWAHRVAGRFGDGQLYLNLRGYDCDQPLGPAQALAVLLRELGVATRELPVGVAAMAARYRTMLAGRRMLVVLDNAATADQVRPLLPGDSRCMTVVTSRDGLPALIVREGAVRVTLDLLPMDDAVCLLERILPERVGADPVTAMDLAQRCARLPLALRLAAEYAAARPEVDLSVFVEQLGHEQRRLDVFDGFGTAGGGPANGAGGMDGWASAAGAADGAAGTDGRTGTHGTNGTANGAVRGVFSWSMRGLPPASAELFALLGSAPGATHDAGAIAALSGLEPAVARAVLQPLVYAQMVTPAGSGRFGMHDLLRAYARELGRDLPGRRTAITRLFDYYLAAAAAAMDTLHPADNPPRPAAPAVPFELPDLGDHAAARAWLDRELDTIMAMTACCGPDGWPRHAVAASRTLWRHLDASGQWVRALVVHARALATCRRLGDRPGEAHALRAIGLAYWRLGHGDHAIRRYRMAMDLWQDLDDPAGQIQVLNVISGVYWQIGDYRRACSGLERAAELSRAVGDTAYRAVAMANLGMISSSLGDYPAALRYLGEAVAQFEKTGNMSGKGVVLDTLGIIARRQGRFDEAHGYHNESLRLGRLVGDRGIEANAIDGLGSLAMACCDGATAVARHSQALGIRTDIGDLAGQAEAIDNIGIAMRFLRRLPEAVDQHEWALDILRRIGDLRRQPKVLNSLGGSLTSVGRNAEAMAAHTAALELLESTNNRIERARALVGLADAVEGQAGKDSQRERVVQLLTEAVACYRGTGMPEYEAVRSRIAGHCAPAVSAPDCCTP